MKICDLHIDHNFHKACHFRLIILALCVPHNLMSVNAICLNSPYSEVKVLLGRTQLRRQVAALINFMGAAAGYPARQRFGLELWRRLSQALQMLQR
jgi:hypothetical protein